MADTYHVSKLNKIHWNSTSGTTGEITSTSIDSDNTDIEIEVSDNVTDPDGATVFTVARMSGSTTVNDYDDLFVETMNNGSTVEEEMASRNTIYAKFDLEGKSLEDSTGSNWFEVRPVARPQGDVGTDDALLSGVFEFTHSDHGGVQR